MYQIKITIPGLPKLSMNGSHSTWRMKLARTRQWQKAVMLAVGRRKPEKPLEKARITYTRFSSRRPDHDNMVASFKAVQDGLVKAGVIIDDKFNVIGVPNYHYEKAPRGKGYITVEVLGGDSVRDDDTLAQG